MNRYFFSDNGAGAHPEVMAALQEVNRGHVPAYGDDSITAQTKAHIQRHFGESSEVFLVLTGTAANILSMQSLISPYQAVICADCAHVQMDECGAPEKHLGSKLLPIATHHGKISPEGIEEALVDMDMVHRVQPKLVTITQATEWGTVYTPQEVRDIAECCRRHDLFLHMDGARLANAAVAMDCSLAQISKDCGVDVLSLGATKNGALAAEAVVFFRPELAHATAFWQKQAMQLTSKMRFVAAQLNALLADDLWQRNAQQANQMARYLADSLPNSMSLTMPVQCNAVFVQMPTQAIADLQQRWQLLVWDPLQSVVRLMTSFDTETSDVDALIKDLNAYA